MEDISIFSLLFSGVISSFGMSLPDNERFAFIPERGKPMVFTGTVSKGLSSAENTEAELKAYVLRLDKPVFFKGAVCGEITQKRIALNHSDVAVFQGERVIIEGIVLCNIQTQKEYYINDFSIKRVAE